MLVQCSSGYVLLGIELGICKTEPPILDALRIMVLLNLNSTKCERDVEILWNAYRNVTYLELKRCGMDMRPKELGLKPSA